MIHELRTLLKEMIAYDFKIKKLISIWVLFSVVMGLWMSFNCRKHPPVNHASQVTLRDVEPVGTGIVSGSCAWQFALFTTGRQRELRPEVSFFKTGLKHRFA